jgi:hypothetical protein
MMFMPFETSEDIKNSLKEHYKGMNEKFGVPHVGYLTAFFDWFGKYGNDLNGHGVGHCRNCGNIYYIKGDDIKKILGNGLSDKCSHRFFCSNRTAA